MFGKQQSIRPIRRLKRSCVALIAFAASLLVSHSPAADTDFNDGIDRTAPDFIKASLLIMGPGNELFSGVGHAAFRMECPTFKHDYCYSYEGEQREHQLGRFFAGKLKMGMLAFRTEDLLQNYRTEGRNVRQYTLNLPPEVKLRLWKVFDDKLAQKMTQPYDYNERGCARAAFLVLREALAPLRFDEHVWPSKYDGTRRELTSVWLDNQPWSRFFLHAIWGTAVDKAELPKMDKVVIPADLLEFLKTATIQGKQLITDEGIELVAGTPPSPSTAVSPMMVAVGMLLFTVMSVLGRRLGGLAKAVCQGWQGGMLILYALAGLFFAYMVLVSDLPATDWNWLLVPFNPLPLVIWPWRKYWALPFAAVLLVWVAVLAMSSHRLTDPAYYVLASTYSVLFASFGMFHFKRRQS